jgi:putative acetyltransferase
VSPEIVIRPERIADVDAVHAVVAAAFEREAEAALVDALRRDARPFISLVASGRDGVVGHVAFSPIRLDGEGPLAMGLAPLSVLPAMQSCGIGSRLVRAGLQACRAIETGLVFVLGHAEYYPRFGFRPAAELGFYFMSPGAEPSFFVLELGAGAAAGRSGRVRYHQAFDAGDLE